MQCECNSGTERTVDFVLKLLVLFCFQLPCYSYWLSSALWTNLLKPSTHTVRLNEPRHDSSPDSTVHHLHTRCSKGHNNNNNKFLKRKECVEISGTSCLPPLQTPALVQILLQDVMEGIRRVSGMDRNTKYAQAAQILVVFLKASGAEKILLTSNFSAFFPEHQMSPLAFVSVFVRALQRHPVTLKSANYSVPMEKPHAWQLIKTYNII